MLRFEYLNSLYFIYLIRKNLSVFLVSFAGVVADYLTTVFGLSKGFVETHAQYSPINALIIFWLAGLVLITTMPEGKWWKRATLFVASWSFLGSINNILVILTVFTGLII
jgi:hypothetical protein